MPDEKHIVVVLDSSSRFPAAKIVPNTSAKPVLKAIDSIYTDYGQPLSHRTDNGPPFNSEAFRDYSHSKGIEHVTTFPYHPQANQAETFMKPLGKAMKSAHHNRSDKGTVLNQLLSSYRSTPHPATGEPPGAIMFRNGYKSEFPSKHISDESVAEAFHHDRDRKLERGQTVNSSKHRKPSTLDIGDRVYMRNLRTSKFQPVFGPETFTIVDLRDGGAVIESDSNSTKYRRHLDDLKPAPRTSDMDISWFPPPDQPTPPPPPSPVLVPAVPQPRRSTQRTRPPPHLNDYVRFVAEV